MDVLIVFVVIIVGWTLLTLHAYANRTGSGKIIHKAKAEEHPCSLPGEGWFFTKRFNEDDQWQCQCGKIWTRYENAGGEGWK